MNKKGFTTLELILTVILVIIIMTTITSVTFVYRDKSTYEELVTEVTNYKNSLTKIMYDDVLKKDDKVIRIDKIDLYNYRFITANGNEYPLVILKENQETGIRYNEIEYLIPGTSDELVSFEAVDYYEDIDNQFYKIDITFSHRNLEEMVKLHLVVTNL